MSRLHQNNGETLVEVLVGILIVSLVFVVLTGAITSSARISNIAKNTDISFSYDDARAVNPNESDNNRIDVYFKWTDTDTRREITFTETSYLYKANDSYFYTVEEIRNEES